MLPSSKLVHHNGNGRLKEGWFKKVPVCVAGMHRSGTSMVAHILFECGCSMGNPREIRHSGSDNQDGYWEDFRFVFLNEMILNRLGFGWDFPPRARPNWNDERLSRLKGKALELSEEARSSLPWGWKDPRNSLTFPFWSDIVPQLRVIVCLRHPLEVAWSLFRRGQSSYPFSFNLWESYNRRIIEDTEKSSRLVTRYDAWFLDPERELARISSFCDVRPSASVKRRVLRIPSSLLRHEVIQADALTFPKVSSRMADIYETLCEESLEG